MKIADFDQIRTYHNPTARTFMSLIEMIGELRGTINGSDLWIWSAFTATHGELDDKLGISKPPVIVDLRMYRPNVPVHSTAWKPGIVDGGGFKWGAYCRGGRDQFTFGQKVAQDHPVFASYLRAAKAGEWVEPSPSSSPADARLRWQA